MANHQIPRAATRIEQVTGTDADGMTIVCSVYTHTRAGHILPDFYTVQYRQTRDGRIDRASRVTNQITGRRAAARLEAEMREVRRLLAASRR